MIIHAGGLPNKEVTSANWLGTNLNLHPQIKKTIVKKFCEQLTLCWSKDLVGFEATIGQDEVSRRLSNGQMGVAGNHISWAVEEKTRQPLTLSTLPPTGAPIALNTTFAIGFLEDWLMPGMVISIRDSVAGGTINIMIMTAATGAGPYSYTAKVIATGAVTIPAAAVSIGDKIPWTWAATSSCTESCIPIPIVHPTWYDNYTTKFCLTRKVCKTNMMNATWLEGEDGSMCWHSVEDRQVLQQFLMTFESTIYYGQRNVNGSGVAQTTGPDGVIETGDGIERQIAGGNVTAYSLATYTNPTNFGAFLDLIEARIEEWASVRNMASVELFARCGQAAYSLLQKVLEKKAFTAGGCCTLHDFSTGEATDYELGQNITCYHFAGHKLYLEKCMLFSNTSYQHIRAGASTAQESYKFIIHPRTTCEGRPLYEIYFREGCGVSSAFTYKVKPGKLDPTNPKSVIAANFYDGYEVAYDTEFVVIVNEPESMLLFQPIA